MTRAARAVRFIAAPCSALLLVACASRTPAPEQTSGLAVTSAASGAQAAPVVRSVEPWTYGTATGDVDEYPHGGMGDQAVGKHIDGRSVVGSCDDVDVADQRRGLQRRIGRRLRLFQLRLSLRLVRADKGLVDG